MISFVYLLANDEAVNIILRVDVGHAVEREIQAQCLGSLPLATRVVIGTLRNRSDAVLRNVKRSA